MDQFVDQWLDVGAVDRVAVNPEFYPDWNDDLKPSIRDETEHFFAESAGSPHEALSDFLDSDFAMLDRPCWPVTAESRTTRPGWKFGACRPAGGFKQGRVDDPVLVSCWGHSTQAKIRTPILRGSVAARALSSMIRRRILRQIVPGLDSEEILTFAEAARS